MASSRILEEILRQENSRRILCRQIAAIRRCSQGVLEVDESNIAGEALLTLRQGDTAKMGSKVVSGCGGPASAPLSFELGPRKF